MLYTGRLQCGVKHNSIDDIYIVIVNDWLIEAYSPGFWTKRLELGLEQWQSSGTISIIVFGLRVYSTRYIEHNTKINIECTQ